MKPKSVGAKTVRGTTSFTIPSKKPWTVSKGHSPHRGGSGLHDSRTNRQRTRSTAFQAAVSDS